jgi:hypothetical protein
MLTQLATVKERLGLLANDAQFDSLLTRAIEAVSVRFDRECNRTLARTVGAMQEFPASETEILARCYPVEVVSKFQVKVSEAEGWVEQAAVGHLVREGGVVSLIEPLVFIAQSFAVAPRLARMTYTGGYVLPGTAPVAGQAALPADLETAAIEQVAVWFQQREKLGLVRHWPSGGVYMVFSQLPLLPQVVAMLRPYRRWSV